MAFVEGMCCTQTVHLGPGLWTRSCSNHSRHFYFNRLPMLPFSSPPPLSYEFLLIWDLVECPHFRESTLLFQRIREFLKVILFYTCIYHTHTHTATSPPPPPPMLPILSMKTIIYSIHLLIKLALSRRFESGATASRN